MSVKYVAMNVIIPPTNAPIRPIMRRSLFLLKKLRLASGLHKKITQCLLESIYLSIYQIHEGNNPNIITPTIDIKNVNDKTLQLTTNKKALEKFARETYYMKKNNEVVYLFINML